MKRTWLLMTILLPLVVGCDIGEIDLGYHFDFPKATSSEETVLLSAYVGDGANETKTTYDISTKKLLWSPGDKISLFYGSGTDGGQCFTSTNTESSKKADFSGTISVISGVSEDSEDIQFWGIYPYDNQNVSDGTSVTVTVKNKQPAAAETFGEGQFVSIGRSPGLSMGFFNLCGGFYVKFTRDDIVSVKLRGKSGESVAGRVKVVMNESGKPQVQDVLDGKSEIRLAYSDGRPFTPNVGYFIICLPTQFSDGFEFEMATSDGYTGVKSFTNNFKLERNRFQEFKKTLDDGVEFTEGGNSEEPDDPSDEGGTESGLYFGLSTFDRDYYRYPIQLISEETKESYNSTVNGLSLSAQNGTLLYYSCDEDITAIKNVTLPSDIANVALVTFTDGLDEGSLNKHIDLYRNKQQYLDALKNRFANETVCGLPIKSYAVGLFSGSAEDEDYKSEFRALLNDLASSEQYEYEVEEDPELSQLNSVFAAIAEELSQRTKLQTVHVQCPLPDDGGRIRFTMDPNTNANTSELYIEGVVEWDSWSIHDIKYQGFAMHPNDDVVNGYYDGFEIHFVFEGLQTSSGVEINSHDIREWEYTSRNTWIPNDEFSPVDQPEVIIELSSALVVLNLDLSRSLTGKLTQLKQVVNNFISTLYTNSVDPNEIKTIKLNKTSINLIVGQSETLQATISPSTASASGLRWVSLNPAVATINQSGRINAVSEGTTIISVSTEDGREMATCTVTVRFQHVESISLDKTNLQIYVGKTASLVATVSPSNANNPAVTWTSSNPDVATVNESGIVTALTSGNTSITVSSVDGDKTATCAVSVSEFIPSSTPRDLTLAISSPDGERYFLTQSELQYVNLDNYIVEGLYVVGVSGFIMSLKDASSTSMCFDAASSFFYLPNREQGMAISSRFSDINTALAAFGGNTLSSMNGSDYWTSEQDASAGSNYHYYIHGSGGSLSSKSDNSTGFVREVVPLSFEAPWNHTLPSDILLSVSNGSSRMFVSTQNDIPDGYSCEGVTVSAKGIRFIMALQNASSNSMNYSAASALYGSSLPDSNQAKLISARFSDINTALNKFGGSTLSSISGSYYWTSQEDSSSGNGYHFCIYGSGGKLTSISDTRNGFVRLIVGTY